MSIVFFDIEGTLVDKTRRIPPSTPGTIRKLRESGHRAFINTGRSLAEIPHEILDIGFDGIVSSNGSAVDICGKRLLNKTIPGSSLHKVLSLFQKQNIAVWLGGSTHIYVEDIQPDGFMGQIIDYLNQGRDIVRSWQATKPEANSLTYFCSQPGQIEPLAPLLQESFSLQRHNESMGQLFLKGCDKATGMDFVLRHLDPAAQGSVYAFGDEISDIPMLKKATYGIAMTGAAPPVLEACAYIAPAPEDHGIETALKYYQLIP